MVSISQLEVIVKFHVIFLQLKQALKDGGAQKEFYTVQLANLVIADNCKFSQYEEAIESNIPVVTVSLLEN